MLVSKVQIKSNQLEDEETPGNHGNVNIGVSSLPPPQLD